MGVIKPTYNNFSSGEITPRLYGRSDSPVFATGVERMENFIPDQFGSARRRGGFEFLDAVPGVERIIPWSIDNELDILILLLNGKMQFYSVWRDESVQNGFLTFNSAPIEITVIDDDPYSPMYTTQHIQSVKYAQGIRTIYMAHQDRPLFFVRFVSYSDVNGYELEYGAVGFEGNIASTPEVTSSQLILSTDPIAAVDILSRCAHFAEGINYTADSNSYINGSQIASVRRQTYGSPTSVDIFLETKTFGANLAGNGRYLAGQVCAPDTFVYDRTIRFMGANGAPVASLYRTFNDPPGISASEVIDIMRSYQLTPQCGITIVRSGSDYKGTFILNEATTANEIILNKVGGGTIVVRNTTAGLVGSLKITGPRDGIIEINKNTVTGGGAAVLDNVAAWMTPDVEYPCTNEMEGKDFQGIRPQYAVKKLTGPNRTPVLLAFRGSQGGATQVAIKGGDKSVRGQLFVNLNPMARSLSFPGFVCFHQNRLVVGGSKGEPNTVYLSKINNHTNFQFFDEIEFEQNILKNKDDWLNPNVPEWDIRNAVVQQISADSAICLRIMTDENEAIMWGASVKDLVLGTNTSEWVVPSDITAHSPTVTLTSRNGSADLQGRFIGKGIIFVSRTGNDIKSFNAQYGEMGDSISAQAEHIFKDAGGIKGFDFRQDPHTEIFAALKDGTIGAATMHPSGLGYYRITTRPNDLIDSVAVINENDEDGVYILAKRLVNGGHAVFLERLRTTDDSTFLGRMYLDSYSSGSTGAGTLVGLERFYKATFPSQNDLVISFADGRSGQPIITDIGECTSFIDEADGVTKILPVSTNCVIGYKYRSHLKLNRTDSMEMEGVPKQGGSMYLRLYKSGDVFLVRDYDMDQLVRVYTPNNVSGQRIYPYTGGIRVENIAPAGPDQNIEIMTDTHESATIQVVSSMYTVGEGI